MTMPAGGTFTQSLEQKHGTEKYIFRYESGREDELLDALIDQAEVKSISVMIMQVPCCSGLLKHVVDAAGRVKARINWRKLRARLDWLNLLRGDLE